MSASTIELAGSEGDSLAALFRERFGHALEARTLCEMQTVARKLAQEHGFQSVDNLVDRLRALPVEAPLVQQVVQAATNNETYFFRDPLSMDTLRAELLPLLIAERSESRRLRIWSAGCSSGEEAYSISILVHELLPDRDDWDITILGTDVDAAAIEKAARGAYTPWSLRCTTDAQKSRYFEPSEDGRFLSLKTKYRRPVSFRVYNLLEADTRPEHAPFDLVLCRNVTIYMHEEGCWKIARRIREAMQPHALWIAGPSDPVPKEGFSSTVHPGLISHSPCSKSEPPRRTFSFSPANRRAAPRSDIAPPPFAPDMARLVAAATCSTGLPPTDKGDPIPPPAPRKLEEGDRDQDRAPPTRSANLLAWAKGRADCGDLVQAALAIEELLKLQPTNADAYRVRAMLHESAGRDVEALGDLKRVLYLEPECATTYLRVGLLLLRTGHPGEAISPLRNALVMSGPQGEFDIEVRRVAGQQLLNAMRLEGDELG